MARNISARDAQREYDLFVRAHEDPSFFYVSGTGWRFPGEGTFMQRAATAAIPIACSSGTSFMLNRIQIDADDSCRDPSAIVDRIFDTVLGRIPPEKQRIYGNLIMAFKKIGKLKLNRLKQNPDFTRLCTEISALARSMENTSLTKRERSEATAGKKRLELELSTLVKDTMQEIITHVPACKNRGDFVKFIFTEAELALNDRNGNGAGPASGGPGAAVVEAANAAANGVVNAAVRAARNATASAAAASTPALRAAENEAVHNVLNAAAQAVVNTSGSGAASAAVHAAEAVANGAAAAEARNGEAVVGVVNNNNETGSESSSNTGSVSGSNNGSVAGSINTNDFQSARSNFSNVNNVPNNSSNNGSNSNTGSISSFRNLRPAMEMERERQRQRQATIDAIIARWTTLAQERIRQRGPRVNRRNTKSRKNRRSTRRNNKYTRRH